MNFLDSTSVWVLKLPENSDGLCVCVSIIGKRGKSRMVLRFHSLFR